MSCHTHYCRDEICEHVLTYEISCSISQLLGVKGNRRKERKGWEGKYNNGSKINTAHTLFCCLNCIFLNCSCLPEHLPYVNLCGMKASSGLLSFPLLLPSTLLKWHSVKTKTLLEKQTHQDHLNQGKHILAVLYRKEDTWHTYTHAGQLNTYRWCTHTACDGHVCCQDGLLWFYQTSRPQSEWN